MTKAHETLSEFTIPVTPIADIESLFKKKQLNSESEPKKAYYKSRQEDDIKREREEAFEFLSSLETFSKLPSEDLKILSNNSRIERIQARQYINTEGDKEGLNAFVVLSGRIAMTKSSISGKELIVELLEPGDTFGLLLALSLEHLPTQLSARATTNSIIIWLPIKNLISMLDAMPILYRELLSHALHFMHSSYDLSRGLAHDRVEVRIASILIILALKFSHKRSMNTHGKNRVDITRQQLADLTGTTPETAIRVTRAMQAEGLIDIKHPGLIDIINLEQLQLISENLDS